MIMLSHLLSVTKEQAAAATHQNLLILKEATKEGNKQVTQNIESETHAMHFAQTALPQQ